jgi:NAD/NADP transhydrogenase beta subunit
VAFGKLQGILDSKPLQLPGKNFINYGLFGGILAAAGVFATTQDPATAVGALVATAAVGGVLGAHLTASIGAQRGGAEKGRVRVVVKGPGLFWFPGFKRGPF